ncbi:MAG: 50S ribosomal protein L9 [Candidatus Zambryskibacteria bacterium CG_4_9_14_3_um_filter_42_9]|uniref:Large ribosomal subunit protein bL9 n=1 Tax=Candidatus Zambryskibacteria bacterium CG22_combo_CG10-13_8_21_14_all_42_17 TaxID=1975118 RepID=A0A2H0BCT7_9BACT|nr:MAG: 50S ribosomal protein L9 [Candidatus Zambryskibacteria bacterium CG22_combo_CG10-13_8_21_14_all_42_17]PJA36980.1 MAG: 50S ribosomal protein L9 [Candidatus Zambryskibacteria bacterium CG_4_9_14_3_um_filter_42_9]
MKVILLKDVKGVGKKFEEEIVSDGYAINFLIPRKLAVSVSGPQASAIKSLKEQEEKNLENKRKLFSQNISKISGAIFTVKMKANERGHLFASLTAEKISELLKKDGKEVSSEHINISEPIKTTGTFDIPIAIGDKETKFKLEVVPL